MAGDYIARMAYAQQAYDDLDPAAFERAVILMGGSADVAVALWDRWGDPRRSAGQPRNWKPIAARLERLANAHAEAVEEAASAPAKEHAA